MRLERLALLLLWLPLLTGCGPQNLSRGSKEESGQLPATHQKVDRSAAAQTNVSLGRAYLEEGQYKIALDKLEKALELDPKSADAHTVIAVLYEKIDQIADAGAHYKRAAELSPKNGETNNNYGAYLCRHQRFPEADEYFAKALADPFYTTPAVAWSNRGSCAMASGNASLAEESFRRAIERDPQQIEALLHLAQVSYGRKDLLKARAFIQRYEAAAKASAQSVELAMNIEHGLGDLKAESEYRTRLLSEFPESEQAQKIHEANKTP